MFDDYNLERSPPIPEFPDTQEELNELYNEGFKILESEKETEETCRQVVKCPFCGNIFIMKREEGGFCDERSPSECPNCKFPHSVGRKLLEAIYGEEALERR